MNGTAMVWQTLQSDDKRSYYWNKETNTTSWVKPDELLTPAQRATGYAETSAAGGRTYWYRKDDKSVTTWEAPPGWFESAPQASAPEEPNQFVTSSFPTYGEQRSLQGPRDEYRPRHDKPSYDRQNEGFRGAMAVLSSGPEYATEAEAETAFFKLLRKAGVQTDWTWEQTMRATIQDPQFRALKDPSERKLAFEKFVDELKVQEREKEKERALKSRQDFRAMLNSHHEIKYYTRWKTALPMIEGEAVFRSTKDEDEKKRRRDRRRSRSRTVDMDPYEADRRKHTAERERHYRQASHGLSPPPRDRRARDDRYERDDRDRRERQVSLSVYDRERREREAERERSYITRADPRAKPSELDYGDSSDGPSRPESSLGKRADSDRGHERRPAKRPRTDRGGERPFSRDGKSETPAAAPADKEMHDEPALQSGSEEGEIEEV
ncbi:U1 snRNP protein [Zalaria obscura]|uniref:U1 snRNP protein n=1 Tax=Zalaria obscura TaxID=2024903 RepID=A0ACC3S6Q5_9PEZI